MWPHRPAGFNEGRAPVNVDELISNYPILYHSTAAGNARAIVDHGLWTTAQIADTAQLDPNQTAAMVAAPRPRAVKLTHPVLGDVQIRDQSPLRPAMLARCLTDLTPAQWFAILNDRAFFWLHPSRLHSLLSGRRNRDAEHEVVAVDTASLVDVHHDRIRLSPINSGAVLYPNAAARGSHTFTTVSDYPFAERRRTRPVHGAVAELAVIGGVHDVTAHTIKVQRWAPGPVA
jgi:hypothetical protein